jgi:hypothetical protein
MAARYYVENSETRYNAGDETGYAKEQDAKNRAGALNHSYGTTRYRVITRGGFYSTDRLIMTTVWLAFSDSHEGDDFTVIGIFSTEEKAHNACVPMDDNREGYVEEWEIDETS